MKLIDVQQQWQTKTTDGDELFDNLEKAFEILGITHKSALEFSTHNISNFNEICEDGPNTLYYSIGAKKKVSTMSKILRTGHKIIVNDTFGI